MGTKLEVRIAKMEAIFGTLLDTLKRMDERMEGMDHVIRGNGKPGLVADMQVLTTRVSTLEDRRNHWRDLFFTVVGGASVGIVVFLFSYQWSQSHEPKNLPQVQSIQRR